MMKEISLEQRESVFQCGQELHSGLNLLRNERTVGAVSCDNGRAVLLGNPPDVNLEVIGVGDQLLPRVAVNEVVQGDSIALHFELLAGGNDLFVYRDRLLNLDDRLFRRQKKKEFL